MQNVQLSFSSRVSCDPNQYQVMASIFPLQDNTRQPVDICCVIDISGSMGTSASAQGIEDSGLSVLDIVKHSVKTIISCLEDYDRISIVSYSDYGKIELGLTYMTQDGKNQALQILTSLYPNASTNIWDGLLKGMESLEADQSLGRNTAIFLLTDGVPNIFPPKGHLPMMRDYKDSHNGSYPGTISTFGFGYNLKSDLLNDIALEGGGSYSFIPDSGFVGTIFVNALSNQLASFARQASLSLELANGAALVPENLTAACSGINLTSWGAVFSIGNLPFHQRRDFVFTVDVSKWNRRGPFVEGTLSFKLFSSEETVTITSETGNEPSTGMDLLILESNIFRSILIDRMTLPSLLEVPTTNTPPPAGTTRQWLSRVFSFRGSATATTTSPPVPVYRVVGVDDPQSIELARDMIAWCDVVESNNTELPRDEVKKLKDYVTALHLDLTGEVEKAFEYSAHQKWGRHYLPSIRRAHQLQVSNNFKDPGVQFYGGSLFNSLRDRAEDMFCTLPAPTPSRAPQNCSYYSSAPQAYASTSSAPSPSYDMSAYMNAAAGCISGDSQILLADGQTKFMKDIEPGDRIRCNSQFNNPNQKFYEAPVECVVRTKCSGPVEMVQFKNGLKITPWHPVWFATSKWIFPMEVSNKSELFEEEYVYNIILGNIISASNSDGAIFRFRGQSYIANGLECISLAHGIQSDLVAQHDFYGTENVVESLKFIVGPERYREVGYVTLEDSQVIRDPITGRVCKYSSLH